jgi:hypothetical protein
MALLRVRLRQKNERIRYGLERNFLIPHNEYSNMRGANGS